MIRWLVAPVVGVGLLAAAGGFPDMGPMGTAKRECKAALSGSGITSAEKEKACSCLVDKASAWKDANPDAEYTRSVHQRFAVGCLGKANWNRNMSSDWGGSRSTSYSGEFGEPTDRASARPDYASDWGN